jgi:glyoxylase-like metal-dependent hydrolase (beta-lactamase superfamily II)
MRRFEWQVIDEERGVLWREYPFTKSAFATTLAFRGADGMVVISPGTGLEPADYDFIAKYGEVRALVANNTHHHLGQKPWRARFPNAKSYAANDALPRLRKQAPEVGFESLDHLALPEHAKLHALPGVKNGELFGRVTTNKGPVWYTGDILTNIQETPGPPIKWLFTLTDSGPGFKLFRLAVWLFVKDKQAMRSGIEALFAKDPPAIIVPAHGPPLTAGDVAQQAKEQLAKL